MTNCLSRRVAMVSQARAGQGRAEGTPPSPRLSRGRTGVDALVGLALAVQLALTCSYLNASAPFFWRTLPERPSTLKTTPSLTRSSTLPSVVLLTLALSSEATTSEPALKVILVKSAGSSRPADMVLSEATKAFWNMALYLRAEDTRRQCRHMHVNTYCDHPESVPGRCTETERCGAYCYHGR